MLNRRYFSLGLSITIHLILLFVLLSFPSKTPPVISPNKKVAIKSYLYKKPIIVQQVNTKKTSDKQEINKQVLSRKPPITKEVITTNKIKKTIQQNRKKPAKAQRTTAKSIITKTPKKFDATEQLSNFRSQLNRRMLQDEFSKYNRPRNLSSMEALPEPVPRAKIIENNIIEKEKATTNYSSDIAIIKLDNGSCLLKQDLTNVGIAGVTAVSGFQCGRTKMEKAFSNHMNKVLKKLGKK